MSVLMRVQTVFKGNLCMLGDFHANVVICGLSSINFFSGTLSECQTDSIHLWTDGLLVLLWVLLYDWP